MVIQEFPPLAPQNSAVNKSENYGQRELEEEETPVKALMKFNEPSNDSLPQTSEANLP